MAPTTTNPMLQLSQRAQRVQEMIGFHHRKIVAQFMEEQYTNSIGDGTCGVFLSGGIDSGSMIFSLIEDCGKTVDNAYTAVIASKDGEGFIESADYVRAKKICEYYGIAHHVVVIPRDPDYVCGKMVEVAQQYSAKNNWLRSRSDFEVMVMYFACVDKAAEMGDSVIFSGLLDGSIHLHNRKVSVPNKKRETAFGHYRMMIESMNNLSAVPAQSDVITQKCEENDITIHLSHSSVAAQYPYAYLPWRMLNRPRDKWISILAYADDYEKTTGSPFPVTMAMQVGDSGARQFFDEMVARSEISDEIVGKRVSTSKVFTNALSKINQQQMVVDNTDRGDEVFPYTPDTDLPEEAYDDRDAAMEDMELLRWMEKTYGSSAHTIRWLNYLTSGGPRPGGPLQIDEQTGRAVLDYLPEMQSHNPLTTIGHVSRREEVYVNEDGEVDDRVDCFGSPLHRGPAFANTECPRAQAGLCGHRTREEGEEKPELHKCTVFDTWGSEVARTIWNFSARTELDRATHHEWSASSNEVLMMLKTGVGAFIRNQEKFFE